CLAQGLLRPSVQPQDQFQDQDEQVFHVGSLLTAANALGATPTGAIIETGPHHPQRKRTLLLTEVSVLVIILSRSLGERQQKNLDPLRGLSCRLLRRISEGPLAATLRPPASFPFGVPRSCRWVPCQGPAWEGGAVTNRNVYSHTLSANRF